MSRVFFWVNINCPNCVIESKQTCVYSQLWSMLANDEVDMKKNTATRIFDSVRKFYVAVVNKMIKIFPFHDDVLRDLTALNPDPALQGSWSSSSVRELAIWLGWRQMNIITHSSLSFRTTGWLLTMNCRSTLLTVVSTRSEQRWQRRWHLLVECAFQI